MFNAIHCYEPPNQRKNIRTIISNIPIAHCTVNIKVFESFIYQVSISTIPIIEF